MSLAQRLPDTALLGLPHLSAGSGILLVHDGATPRADILGALLARYTVLARRLKDVVEVKGHEHPLAVVDVRIRREADSVQLREAMGRLANRAVRRLFITEQSNRGATAEAEAFGAEAVVSRPFSAETLYPSVDRLIRAAIEERSAGGAAQREGLNAGIDAIERILQFAATGHQLTQEELYGQGDKVVGTLAETGLADWIAAVKRHHSQTFRHSLLVTGVAVGFGQMLGFGHADQRRLALGGLLHDIGKARIPLDILEKPGALDENELAIMRSHAAHGRDIMREKGGFSPEMIDVVAHHHELLDGSGYPDGLCGDRISDLVRTITVADIFSALIEERAYKTRLSSAHAYDIMVGMKGKLDPTLLGAFAHIALRTSLAA